MAKLLGCASPLALSIAPAQLAPFSEIEFRPAPASFLSWTSSEMTKWTPTKSHRADPGEVLSEAIHDAASGQPGRMKLALAKHLWFHNNAVKHRQSLSGVRRSHALRAWRDLAEKYPPARKALVKARNEAQRAVWKRKDPWPSFADVRSINEYLGESARTVSLFRSLHKRSPRRARGVYLGAEEALFRAGEFKLCNNYLEPSERFATIRKTYRVNLRLAKDPTIGADFVQFAQCSFADKTTRLVSLLALNGRVSEARQIARRALRVWSDAQFQKSLASATESQLKAEHG